MRKAMATAKEPSHVVIDKNTTARINVAILVSVLGGLVAATWWLSDIKHSVANISVTLEEVKVQLAKNGGTVNHHAIEIIRLQEQYGSLNARLKALEGK